MANKKKSVAYSAFKAAAEKNYTGKTVVNWNDLEIEIKRNLTLSEVVDFVNIVSSAAFNEEGAYMPEFIDAAILICTVEAYTNINLGRGEIEAIAAYDYIYHSGIFDVIMENIDEEQFEKIVRAAVKKIEHLANTNIQAVTKQVNELGAAFEGLETGLSSLTEGISPEDLRGVVDALSSGVLDEKKLVEAIIDKK